MRHFFLLFLFVLAVFGFAANYFLNSREKAQSPPSVNFAVSDDSQFAQVTPSRPIELPRDHGEHVDFRNEWWYLTANLTDEFGQQWGLQWTLFRFGLSSINLQGWDSPQRYMAHFVLSTPDQQIALQRFARGGIGQAAVIRRPFQMWIDNWEWQGDGESPFPGVLSVDSAEINATFNIRNEGVAVLQGEGGYSTKNRAGTLNSYYFSYPFLAVDGRVTFFAEEKRLTGHGWFDREWSSVNLMPNELMVWDWLSLHLSDTEKLMVYRVRDVQEMHYFGSLVNAKGTHYLDAEDFQMNPISYHRSNNVVWPLKWKIRIPAHSIALDVQAQKKYPPLPFTFSYWEAPVEFTGTHQGVGYMELTGY
ncbi:lipocalin-like domain-containing protein [Thaumasiovibrio sp. DFM-14]|uniref:lipocalin-like domain-containing protein n=1 Tax=Thaumasiovibrio sp. DFM-14 TaxID=3384792 RepID=UPI0039A16AD7